MNSYAMWVSRCLAVLLLTFVFAAVGIEMDRQDRETIRSFTTLEDLRRYVESAYMMPGFWTAWVMLLFVGGFYLVAVEALAAVLRWCGRQVTAVARPDGGAGLE